MRLREQDFDACIGQHERKTLLRIGRIERNVSRSGFDDRQQCDNHLRGTLHEHPDELLPTDAKAMQI